MTQHNRIVRFFLFWWQVFRGFILGGCTYRAAALTYTSLLSLVPLLAVAFAVLALFPGFSAFQQTIETFIFGNFLPGAADVVQQHLQAFIDQASQLPAITWVFLVFTSLLLIYNIEQALNMIWQVEKRRRGLISFAIYIAVLVITPMLVGFGLVASSYLMGKAWFAGAANLVISNEQMLILLPYVLNLLAFTLVYWVIPSAKVPLRYAILGGFVTTVLFELAKYGFAIYAKHFHTYALVYGALAVIPIFLLWVYLSWLVILFGAEVSRRATLNR